MLVGMRPSIFTPVFLLLLSDQVPVAGQLQNATVDPDDGAENSTLNVPQPLYRHLKADKDAVLGCPASGDRHTVPNPDCNLIGPFPKGQRFFSEHISPTYFNYVCPAGQIFCMEMNGRGLVDGDVGCYSPQLTTSNDDCRCTELKPNQHPGLLAPVSTGLLAHYRALSLLFGRGKCGAAAQFESRPVATTETTTTATTPSTTPSTTASTTTATTTSRPQPANEPAVTKGSIICPADGYPWTHSNPDCHASTKRIDPTRVFFGEQANATVYYACAEGTVFCAGVYETVPNIPVRLQDFLSPPMLLMLLPYAGCYRNSSVAAPANRCKCSAHASNFTAETSLVYTVSAELEELQGQLWNGSMRTCRGLDADALRPRHATLRVYERYTRSSAATTNVIYSQLITIVCLYVSISLRSLAL